MKSIRFVWLPALALLVFARAALGYFLPPPLSLEKLEAEADLIFKGEAVETEPVQDESLQPMPGYEARETRFKVISTIKGEAEGGEVRFRHYDEDFKPGQIMVYEPQWYHFESGRTYLIFAHKNGASYSQMAMQETAESAVLRCRDQQAVAAKTMREMYWMELMAMRDSPVAEDAVYALHRLDRMSGGSGWFGASGLSDFPRPEVLIAVRGQITRPEPEVAQAAILIIGSGNPYLSDDLAPFWLGTVGVPNSGLSPMSREEQNAGATLCWRDLVAVANSKAPAETRALAIRALGRLGEKELPAMIDSWLEDPEGAVRAAAILLRTDFPVSNPFTREEFADFAKDRSPEVRKCAAYAIGFIQELEMVPLLRKFLQDKDKDVRRAAGESLRSFHPENPLVAAALKADMRNPETAPLSMLALAVQNPAPYLDELGRVIRKKTEPKIHYEAPIPASTAWEILFRYLQDKPAADIRAGKWNRYLDTLEDGGVYIGTEPSEIYELYLQRGLPERAAKYRAKVKKTKSYDLEP